MQVSAWAPAPASHRPPRLQALPSCTTQRTTLAAPRPSPIFPKTPPSRLNARAQRQRTARPTAACAAATDSSAQGTASPSNSDNAAAAAPATSASYAYQLCGSDAWLRATVHTLPDRSCRVHITVTGVPDEEPCFLHWCAHRVDLRLCNWRPKPWSIGLQLVASWPTSGWQE